MRVDTYVTCPFNGHRNSSDVVFVYCRYGILSDVGWGVPRVAKRNIMLLGRPYKIRLNFCKRILLRRNSMIQRVNYLGRPSNFDFTNKKLIYICGIPNASM